MNKIFFLSVLGITLFTSGCSTRGPSSYIHHKYSSPTYSQKKYSHPTMRPYVVHGKRYYPTVVSVGDRFRGNASWYGPNFHGKFTSNGERYNMWDMTAAHKTLPMNTIVRVTNRRNGKSTVVRINDRGPFVSTRIIDLSKAAASKIDMIGTGTAPVTLEVLGFAGKGKNKIPNKKQLKKSPKSVELSSFALQIASFSNINGAIRTQEKYNNTDGYTTVIKDMQTPNGRMFKVWLKGFKSEQEARDYKANGIFKGAFIVRED
ncbi:septal ring lytic transglycosylase RlpA family protein [Sulfurimonas sp. NWX367]|uniref:septal ring lytic transglycosylase RlpA family protein n=1 Tax=Sulfurimonas sp. NWX367 TaxID=2925413 RepID=UPI003204B2FB